MTRPAQADLLTLDASALLETLAAIQSELDVQAELTPELRELAIDLCKFSTELARIDGNGGAAAAGEFTVRLQPGDRLRMFLAALRARDVDRSAIKGTGHGLAPMGKEP